MVIRIVFDIGNDFSIIYRCTIIEHGLLTSCPTILTNSLSNDKEDIYNLCQITFVECISNWNSHCLHCHASGMQNQWASLTLSFVFALKHPYYLIKAIRKIGIQSDVLGMWEWRWTSCVHRQTHRHMAMANPGQPLYFDVGIQLSCLNIMYSIWRSLNA